MITYQDLVNTMIVGSIMFNLGGLFVYVLIGGILIYGLYKMYKKISKK